MKPSAVKKIIVIIALFVTLTAFQINNAILQTALSGKFFASVYDKYDPTAFLLDKAVTVPAVKSNTAGEDIFYYTNLYLDRAWFTKEAPVMLKGFYSYFSGASDRLPVLNIMPVKSILTDVVIYEVLVEGPREEAAFKIALIFKAFDSLVKSYNIRYGTPISDNTLNEVLVSDEFGALGLSIDKATLNNVLSTYVFMRESGSKNADIMKAVVDKTLDGLTGISSTGNELDLNKFTAILFNEDDDPAKNLRSVIISYKVISTVILAIITAALLFALFLLYLRRNTPLKENTKGSMPLLAFILVTGIVLTVLGLISFITGIQGKLMPLYGSIYSIIRPATASASLAASGNAVNAVLEIMGGVYRSLLMQGAILIAAGFALLVAGIFAKDKTVTAKVIRILRKAALPVAVVAVAVILALTAVMAYKVSKAANSFNRAATSHSVADYAKALAESLEAEKMYAYFTDVDSGFMNFFSGVEEDDEEEAAEAYSPPLNVPFVEDEAATSLRQFYRFLSSLDNYGKGMDMLDSNFTMTIGFLKQFGIESLSKEDISQDSASEYMDILSNSSITAITWVNTTGNISRIYYNQLILMEEGLQANSKLAADLELRNGIWIITRIIDQSKLK